MMSKPKSLKNWSLLGTPGRIALVKVYHNLRGQSFIMYPNQSYLKTLLLNCIRYIHDQDYLITPECPWKWKSWKEVWSVEHWAVCTSCFMCYYCLEYHDKRNWEQIKLRFSNLVFHHKIYHICMQSFLIYWPRFLVLSGYLKWYIVFGNPFIKFGEETQDVGDLRFFINLRRWMFGSGELWASTTFLAMSL